MKCIKSRLDHIKTGPYQDWTISGLDHIKTGPYQDWTISGLDHIKTGPYQDWTIAHGHLRTNHSQFLHTSSKRNEPKHKQRAGSLSYTSHDQ